MHSPDEQKAKGEAVQKNSKRMKKEKRSTRPSRVVPHRSTTPARACLTSLFGWEAVSQADMAALKEVPETRSLFGIEPYDPARSLVPRSETARAAPPDVVQWSPQIYYNHHEDVEDLVNSQSVTTTLLVGRSWPTRAAVFPNTGGR